MTSVEANAPAGPQWGALGASPRLSTAAAEWALERLLDDVYADRIPAAARGMMHEYYDRFRARRSYFLHHFAPLLATLDRVFSIAQRRPRLLDLGCGVGTQAYLLALRGADVVGIDATARRIGAAWAMQPWYANHAAAPMRCELVLTDALTHLRNAPPGSFDGVYTQFALAYMPPQAPILRELGRVVRPGGTLVLREFNSAGLYNRLGAKVTWPSDSAYIRMAKAGGWRCRARTFSWFLPRAAVELGGRRRARVVERALERMPGARWAGAVQTLVFERSGPGTELRVV